MGHRVHPEDQHRESSGYQMREKGQYNCSKQSRGGRLHGPGRTVCIQPQTEAEDERSNRGGGKEEEQRPVGFPCRATGSPGGRGELVNNHGPL